MEFNECEWVGSECGTHAAYTFYKGLKYRMSSGSGHPQIWKVMGIGQFLFVRIWGQTDLVSVAEVQLLWEDKSTSQKMCSIRLYFLPEFTSEGRLPHHGEDEMVAVAEKGVLRVVDLLDWLVPLNTLNWDRGAKSVATRDCPTQPDSVNDPTSDKTKLDLSEVEQARIDVGDNDIEERGILILSASNYHRYRALHKRLEGVENEWMKNNLISALGGFTTLTRNTSIMFAKEIFDYPELEEHPQLTNHLAPKMKGRPRKKQPRNAQNEDELSPSNEANDLSFNCDKVSNGRDGYLHRGGGRKDILSALIINNTPQEIDFLTNLIKFLDEQGTGIEKPPSIGLKQIDLYSMYKLVVELGGYESCMLNKSWKQVYDTLEDPSNHEAEPTGAQNNNSAGAQAVHTRRHYERYLLPYERHMMLNSTNTNTDGVANSLTIKSLEKGERKPEITLDENSGLQLLDGKPDPIIKSGNATICNNKDEPVKTESKVEPKQSKQYLGIKPLQLLTEPKDKSPSPASAVSDARLDLSKLILPSLGGSLDLSSPLGGGGLDDPGSGSALQNLAKIASRYSKDKSRTQEFLSPGSKRQRLIDPATPPGVIQPLPATPPSASPSAAINSSLAAAAVAMAGVGAGGSGADGGITASALLQQFSLMSPLLSGLTSSSNATTSQEGYNLLKYYEQQWKLLQQQGSSVSGGSSSHGSTPPPSLQPPSLSSSRKESSPALSLAATSLNDKNKDTSKIGKEKNKVNKPPPDTVKPPRLLQNPCQFLQTSTIYGSPKSDLDKVKENAIKAGVLHLANTAASMDGQGVGGPQPPVTTQLPNQVLDLSSGCMEFRTVSPHHRSSLGNLSSPTPPPPSQDKRTTFNNRTPTTTSSMDNGIDLRMNSTRTSTPQGAKNFSAEALIGNNNSSNSSPSSHHTIHSSSPSSHTHNKQSSGRDGVASPVKRPSSSTPTWHPASSSSPGMNRNNSGPRASPSLGGVSHRSAYSPLSSPSAASALQQQYQLAAAQSSSTTSASSANAAYLQALMMSSKGATSTVSSASGSSSAAAQSAASQYAAAMAAALGGSSSQQAAMMAALGGSGSSQQAAMAAALGGGSSSQQAAMIAALGGGSSSQQAAMIAALGGGSSSSQQAAMIAALGGSSSSQQAAMSAALGGGSNSQQAAMIAALSGGSSSQQAAMAAALGGGSSSQQAAMVAALGGGSSSQQAAMAAALGGGSSSQQAAMAAALSSSSSQQAAMMAALGGSNASSQAAMAAALSGQQQRGMDPLMSQYYSMLYSQQLAAAASYNPYAAAALSAGMQPPSTTSSGRSSAIMSSMGGSNSAYNQLTSSQGGPISSASFPGIYSTASSLAGANLMNALSYSSAGSTSAPSSYSNNHSSSAAASLSSLYGLYPPTSVPVTGSSSSLAAAMAAAAGGGSAANSSASLAAQLAAASGGSMSSYSNASLAALMGAAPSSMSGSSSLAAMAAGSGFPGGAGSGLSMMPSSLGGPSSGGSGSASATELQMYQAYQDLLSRSSAPNSSSMFNMGAFLGGGASGAGHPHNLGQRKE